MARNKFVENVFHGEINELQQLALRKHLIKWTKARD